MPSSPPSARLRRRLYSLDCELWAETDRLVEVAQPILWHTLSTFPSGTSHTPEHTATVELIASMLIPDAMLAEVTADELQLLILGCHYHDLGMAGTEAQNLTAETRDQARREHAITIGDILRDKWRVLGFRDSTLAEALAEVCRGHRPPKKDGMASWETTRKLAILGPDRSARLRLVAALIYAADELHLGADRAPTQVQEWLQITNEESRRHWQRHQLISGPALIDERLHFEVSAPTVATERDLHVNVIQKALSAIAASCRQLQAEGVAASLNGVSIAWRREQLWELLMLQVASDYEPRTPEQLTHAIVERYLALSEDFEELPSNTGMAPADFDALAADAARVVSDYHCKDYLQATDDSDAVELLPSLSITAARRFFDVADQADKLDTLFEGRHAAHHDFDLQRSKYGATHTNQSVKPLVGSTYGILIGRPEHSDLSLLLESSPTARQLAIEGAPAPSILAKEHPLSLAILAGASLDVLREPALMLDERFRDAYRTMVTKVQGELHAFTRLAEEIALVDGYTYEQIRDAFTLSEAAAAFHNESLEAEATGTSLTKRLTIRQQVPAKWRPAAGSFAHLFLAGQRAKTKVELLSIEEAPLTIKEEGQEAEASASELVAIAFQPVSGLKVPTVAQRGDFEYDGKSKTLTVRLRKREKVLDSEAPLLVTIQTKGIGQSEPVATTLSFAFHMPALRARHMRAFKRMGSLAEDDEVVVRLADESGSNVAFADKTLTGSQLRHWSAYDDFGFAEYLFERDPDAPLPLISAADVTEAIASGERDHWEAVYEKYSAMAAFEKPEVMSLNLRIAHSDGTEYQDRSYGLIPGLSMGAPKVKFHQGAEMSQEDIDRLWEESDKDFMIAGSFSVDEHALLREFDAWAEDPSKPFPINVSGDPPGTPVYRSRCEIVQRPRIDRLWYAERPYIIRVRPINDEERWNVEGSYWQSVGDTGRENLIQERLRSLKEQADARERSPVHRVQTATDSTIESKST